eukprot:Skav228893  [mRNA]  locus=scaffold194:273935:279316:- [translate_table: standard]
MAFVPTTVPQPLPFQLQKLLERFDLCKSGYKDHHGNFAIHQLKPVVVDDRSLIEGTIFDHGTPSSSLLLGASGQQGIDSMIGLKVLLDVDETVKLRLYRSQRIYAHQALMIDTNPLRLIADDSTLLLSLNDEERDQMHIHDWMIEQFCGGFGGWQHALTFLHDQGLGDIRTLAIDNSMECIVQFALTHGFQMIMDDTHLDAQFLHNFPHNTAVKTDIKALGWQKAIQAIFPKYWTISAPCVSWSGVGHRAGFESMDGMTLAHALSHCKIHRPKYVGLEQVEGMTNHEQFPLFLALTKWAGYRFLSADTHEVAAFIPVRRRRWLGLLIRDDQPDPTFKLQAWPLGMVTPLNFDALLRLTDDVLPQFQPTTGEAQIYFDPQFLPPFCNKDKVTVLKHRLPPLTEPFPTVMAAYTQQHRFNPQDLKERGLMGFFVKQHSATQGQTFRYLTPAEVLMLHGTAKPVILAKPATLAYRTLGNMITPLHALATLMEMLQTDGKLDPQLNFSDLANAFLQRRLKASQVLIEEDECAWFVGDPSSVQELRQTMNHFMTRLAWKPHENNEWPEGYFYHVEQGLLTFAGKPKPDMTVISPTLDMHIRVDFQLAFVPGEYGLYRADASLTWNHLQQHWLQKLVPQLPISNFQADRPFETFLSDMKMLMIPTADHEVSIPGPPRAPNAKQDFQKLVESGIASLILDYDIPLPQVPQHVAKLVHQEGNQKLHAILQMPPGPQKNQAFAAVCQQAGIELPARGPIRSKIEGKFQKVKDNAIQKQLQNPDPSLFKLTPGFFCNADGSAATVLTSFSPQASGIIIAKPEEALLWMKSMITKPIDELGVYVLGPIDVPSTFDRMEVDAPATDVKGRALILHGQLLQFGTKHIRTTATSLQAFDTDDIQIASVTLWKKDFEDTLWQRLLDSPVKTVQSLLSLEGLGGIMGQPWGRAFQDAGKNVSPAVATSIQFHATFQVGQRFTTLLRRSGFSKIYICPKSEKDVPDERWKVVWLPPATNLLELESHANNIAGAAGLVLAKKGIGLRVEATNFLNAWKTLKPDAEPPEMSSFRWRFKIHPLPLGVTAEVLKLWAKQNFDWTIRPLRSVGAKQWLIAADVIPSQILTFNSQPLLLQQLPDKGIRTASTISAGPKTFPKPVPANAEDKKAIFRTGDPWMDPWQNATLGNGSDGAKSSVPDNKPILGQVATRMEQQDSRLQAVETMVNQMKEQTAAKIGVIEQQQATMHSALTTHMQNTDLAFQQVRQDHSQTQQTLADALASQEKRMASSFEELKRIFLDTRGTKRVAKNDRAGNDGSDLSDINDD